MKKHLKISQNYLVLLLSTIKNNTKYIESMDFDHWTMVLHNIFPLCFYVEHFSSSILVIRLVCFLETTDLSCSSITQKIVIEELSTNKINKIKIHPL